VGDGDVDEDASVGVVEVDIWTLIIIIKMARLRLRGDAGVAEGCDEKVANEIVTKDRGAIFENRTGEEVIDVVVEELIADAELGEWNGGREREAEPGGEAKGRIVESELGTGWSRAEPV
jgi:hypothetical protein